MYIYIVSIYVHKNIKIKIFKWNKFSIFVNLVLLFLEVTCTNETNR